jgi:hypothetical protein
MEDIEPDLQSLKETMAFDNVTDELKQRLNISKKEGAPILLPPKDYDTISRARGNMNSIDKRKCLNETIVGLNAISFVLSAYMAMILFNSLTYCAAVSAVSNLYTCTWTYFFVRGTYPR